MKIHTFLADPEARSLHFDQNDLRALDDALPGHEFVHHDTQAALLDPANASAAECLMVWRFSADWYPRFPKLQTIFTPAAGRDWVASDPAGRVRVMHGTFHGPILGESLLGAVLFMNHRMPDMIRNFEQRQWNRNLQGDARLLAGQVVLLIGLGHIGSYCARMLKPLTRRVIGVRRSATPVADIETHSVDHLSGLLPLADHVILLLPGTTDTDRFMDPERLGLMKQGAYVYNFGRGNSLTTADLLGALPRLGGAFLDVTDEEPLAATSALWAAPNVFITPHSSCMYLDYTRRFVHEVAARIG
ncbi:MAG: NAD(P)-dependent oxidoreductase [Proteobacteria bacterium]|jgi:D-2-hydroxyacid dehydrogenase (NADP+)|nr:NAD(P)-dependent oxidoreductase [Pseudomonadota bacterium]